MCYNSKDAIKGHLKNIYWITIVVRIEIIIFVHSFFHIRRKEFRDSITQDCYRVLRF